MLPHSHHRVHNRSQQQWWVSWWMIGYFWKIWSCFTLSGWCCSTTQGSSHGSLRQSLGAASPWCPHQLQMPEDQGYLSLRVLMYICYSLLLMYELNFSIIGVSVPASEIIKKIWDLEFTWYQITFSLPVSTMAPIAGSSSISFSALKVWPQQPEQKYGMFIWQVGRS